MKLSFITILTTLFSLSESLNVPRRGPQAQAKVIALKKFDVKELPGAIEPLGFWDPLNLSNNLEEDVIKYTREAELQHGRIAMVTMVTLPLVDYFDKNDIAINAYQQHKDIIFSKEAFSMMLFFETARLLIQYDNPATKLFRLKKDVIPGNIFRLDASSIDKSKYDKELSNGRLAMVGAFLYMIQEFTTQTKIIG